MSIFGTYFYSTLTQKSAINDYKKMLEKQRIKMRNPILIFPVNLDMIDYKHWVLVIIIRGLDNQNNTALIYLDSCSMSQDDDKVLEIYSVLKYVWDWSKTYLVKPICPQQNNDYDWGMFLLQYMHNIIANNDPLNLLKKYLVCQKWKTIVSPELWKCEKEPNLTKMLSKTILTRKLIHKIASEALEKCSTEKLRISTDIKNKETNSDVQSITELNR